MALQGTKAAIGRMSDEEKRVSDIYRQGFEGFAQTLPIEAVVTEDGVYPNRVAYAQAKRIRENSEQTATTDTGATDSTANTNTTTSGTGTGGTA